MNSKQVTLSVLRILTLSLFAVAGLQAATSVTRHEITWTFNGDYNTGVFANGDPWVQEKTLGAGVTIINIDPQPGSGPGGATNGSTINPDGNPWSKQGYDQRGNMYDANRNVTLGGFPFTVQAGDSLVSSISYNTSNTSQQRPVISDASVLTIVAANDTPATGDFRPPYAGTYKPRWNVSDIDWSRLPSLPPPASGASSIAGHYDNIDRLWLINALDATGRDIHPRNHMPEYGRDFSILLGHAMLRTMLDDPQNEKEQLVFEMIQKGIDIYGCTNDGLEYYANGGLNCGMKMPLIYAGYLLNAPEILDFGDKEKHFIFQEDQQTFYVTQSDVDECPKATHTSGAQRDCYTSSMIGTPEWGFNHYGAKNQDGSNWGVIYRNVAGPGMVGHYVAAKVMGVEDIWNWPAFFDYFERYMGIEGDNVAGFARGMWLEYGDLGGGGYVETQVRTPVISPNGGNFIDSDGFDVTLSSVTAGAEIYYTTDGSTPTTASELYSGPFFIADDTTIKAIGFADGLESSSIGQANFTFTFSPPDTQAAPPSISPNGGTFQAGNPPSVTLSTTTSNSAIYYTTDGSMPDATDSMYSGAFTVGDGTTVRAITIADGLDNSTISQATFTEATSSGGGTGSGDYSSNSTWQNEPIISQNQNFTTSLTITPTGENIDTVVALSPDIASTWDDMAVIIRFYSTGTIDARNGDNYESDVAVQYSSGTAYDFTIEVDMNQNTFSVWVSASGLPLTLLANDFAFRTAQSQALQLDYLTFYSRVSGVEISDLAITTTGSGGDLPADPTTLDVTSVQQ